MYVIFTSSVYRGGDACLYWMHPLQPMSHTPNITACLTMESLTDLLQGKRSWQICKDLQFPSTMILYGLVWLR